MIYTTRLRNKVIIRRAITIKRRYNISYIFIMGSSEYCINLRHRLKYIFIITLRKASGYNYMINIAIRLFVGFYDHDFRTGFAGIG